MQRYNKFLDYANFWIIFLKKNFKSFPKQNRKSLIFSDLRFLLTIKVIQNEKLSTIYVCHYGRFILDQTVVSIDPRSYQLR